MNTLFFYIRDKKQFPVACVATVQVKDIICYAWSAWNPKDKFSKKRARDIAEGRLYKSITLESRIPMRWVEAGPGAQERIIWDLFNFKNNPSKLMREAIASQVWERDGWEQEWDQWEQEWDQHVFDNFQPARIPAAATDDERNVSNVSVERRADGANGNSSQEPIFGGEYHNIDSPTAGFSSVLVERHIHDVSQLNREDTTGTANAAVEANSPPSNSQ